MSVPFNRLQTEALDNYGTKELYDNLAQYDGIIEGFGGSEAIRFETGGQPNFRERTLYGKNTNIAARGKNDQISTNDDDGMTMASVPMKVVDGAIVYNQIERDQVAEGSPSQIGNLIQDKIEQFDSTWVQTIADLLRQATPGENDPYTLLPSGTTGTVNGILIARTPTQQGTDGATTAGIDRSNSWWRNQYSNTSFDLATAAGNRGLYLNAYGPCVRGNSPKFQPNIGVCATVVLASFGATVDNNRRATYQDKAGVKRFGGDSFMYHNARLIRDSSSRFLNGSAGKIAFCNTNALLIKVLKGQGGVKREMLTQRNNLKSLPIFWKHKDHSDIDSLNWITVGYITFGFVPRSLQDHGLADNCT